MSAVIESLDERCELDGGVLEIEREGNKLIKTCVYCGMSEKIDIGTEGVTPHDEPDPGAIITTEAVKRAREARDATMSRISPPTSRVVIESVPLDWRAVARERLTTLLAQLTGMGEASKEAVQIYTALTSCGEHPEDLPGFVFDLASAQEELEKEKRNVEIQRLGPRKKMKAV